MIGLVVITLMNFAISFILLFVITDIYDEIKIMKTDNRESNFYIIKEIHNLLMEVTKDEDKKNELKEKINRDKLFASMLKNFIKMNR
jgi:endonuclease III-like uncharacterized protein